MESIHILPDRILHEKMRYVCRHMRLHVITHLKDKIGIYAYLLADASGRRYLFACKRYIYWKPDAWGIVSFTKHLVTDAQKNHWTLLMLIEEPDEEIERNYIYTFNPADILQHGHTFRNEFNTQEMINFDICLATNMEITRRKEILETRVILKEEQEKQIKKDEYNITITRWL